MSPRPRGKGSRDLPPNLYYYAGSFVYRRPDTGERVVLRGVKDRRVAIAAAQELNARLMPTATLQATAAVENVLGLTENAGSFSAVAKRYVDEFLPTRKLVDSTFKDYCDRLDRFRAHFGAARLLETIETREIAEYLDTRPANSGNKDRAQLMMFFKFAQSKGLLRNNPVTATFRRLETKERRRLELPAFIAIRNMAEPWFRNALDLALVTLQRRGDIVVMQFADVQDGQLRVEQGKVERHGTGKVSIPVGPTLEKIIARCRDDVVSPFLVHRKPLRRRREYLEGKEHWTQVAPEMLSREFQRLRDDVLHLYDQLPMASRPTFHEIRSLGAALYRNAGYDPQDLLGHEDAEMTEHYLDGHWTQVKPLPALPIAL